MNPQLQPHWPEIERIFDEALECEDNERAAFVEAACAGDERLRREVEALLAADHKLQQTPRLLVSPLNRTNGTPMKLGAYQLQHEIARGGMGAVWLAHRADEQFEQRVAIKLLRAGANGEDLQRRFHHERQILADLNHPNIARLLDGGTTAEGQPYFVMEYIEGLPIDEYCQQQQLSVRDRLLLFRQVCAAVQYAHQHLIIHRDLKPANILVTADGTPKLLDFGVAKLLQPDLTASHHTQGSATPMTPAYASPEQIRGDKLTTASDVYSLGVVLYELLTGRSPYQLKENTFGELSRAICEQEPTRPSVAATQNESTSSIRNPPSAIRNLKGDLDSIVLMTLRKEPQARYSSVEQFSADVQRYLDGLPTLARKGTFAYRTVKYVRRHKVPVAAAALIALSLLGGIGATSRQAQIARAEQVKANAERLRAEQALAVADEQRRRAEQALAEVEAQRTRAENALTTAEQRRKQAEAARTEANQQRAAAEMQRLAAEAERNTAQTQRQLADEQRQRAETQEFSNRQLLYTSRMGLAQQAWENANLGRLRELLNYYAPQPGELDLRGFEWRYLWRLAHDEREQKTLTATGKIYSILFSPDGRRMFTLANAGPRPSMQIELKVVDVLTEHEVVLYRRSSDYDVFSMSLAPDGEMLAVTHAPGEIKILSARTGEEIRSLNTPPQEAAYRVSFSPDGKRLAVGFYSGAIRLFDVVIGQELLHFKAHLQRVNHVTFSPDGQTLLSGSHDRSLRLWDARTGREVFTFMDGVKEASRSLSSAFTPDGKHIIVAGSGNLLVWEAATDKQVFYASSAGEKIAVSSDGKVLAVGGEDAKNNAVITLYDTTTWKERDSIKAHERMITALAFAPDGRHLASGGEDRILRYWNLDSPQPPQVTGDRDFNRGSFFQTALTPDGQRLLAGETQQKASVWDLTTGKRVLTLDGHNEARNVTGIKFAVAASPDGNLFATAGKDNQIKFWDARDGRKLRSLTVPAQAECLSFSPDSRLLAMRINQRFLLLDVASGREWKAWAAPDHYGVPTPPLLFSRDGKTLWSVGNDGTARVWEVATGQSLRVFRCTETTTMHQVALSPDERFFATAHGDGIAKVWEVASGKEVQVFKGHSTFVSALAFSPDGKRLVTGSGDRTVKLWDVATGQELLTLKDHPLDISNGAIHFTPDGKTLVTADWARQIRLWRTADEPAMRR